MEEQSGSAKERILSYVEDRLLKEGKTDIPVDEVAASLGMSKKTFYKVFHSKGSMIEELVTRIVGGIGSRITSISEGPGNFAEKLDKLMKLLGSMYRHLAIPLSGEVYRHQPHVWRRVEEFRENMIRRVFTRLLEQGVAEGFIRPDVNQTIFLMAYLSAIRSIIRPHVVLEQGISIPDAIEQIFRIFFAGIMTAEGRRAFDELQTPKPHIP
jgi:AcrR family transcriptional regulator